MYALVVYESMFGNTQRIARAVAQGLATAGQVEIVEVGSAPAVVDEAVDLLVVGGPTHAFGLTRASTRRSAAEQAAKERLPLVSHGIGLREWLAAVHVPAGTPAAAFDTRVHVPGLPGSAANGAHRRLRKLGLMTTTPSVSFYVTGTAGPLAEGEPERARRWGAEIAARVAAAK
ncbi:flavodoxin domain-containing protein [Spongiactinospora sp. TRM90649]|uniref:flavodoxin family protein n=1 Tax=Spongiactinospora sp. TRM90649 TaxID=3031114 RepID=UPI0023F92C6F|nr:flavodoxin domain-containing protein [Spongiactinospora sp. TRM90649]MDF5755237.1 flavodoxin domain-containing protein [Spongiactinospora sp. TRM90649]